MDWNQLKLTYQLKEDDQLKEALEACGLPLKGNYDELEKEQLRKYLKLIVPDEKLLARFNELVNQGKSRPEAIAEVLAPPKAETQPEAEPQPEGETEAETDQEAEAIEESESPAANGHKIKKRRKPISLFDLMKEGQKLTGKPITLARGQEFLAASGLPEKMEYSGEEATRFLQACDRVVNQGQSLAEVAQAFGVDVGARQTPLDWASKHGGGQTEELERLAEKNAQLGEQVSEVYEQAYFARLQQYFESGEYDRRYKEAKARIRQERGPTPFEQFDAQYRLWQAQQDPLARIREGTPDNPRRIEEGKGE
jgi:transposase-like protein